ncbi:MAG: DUF3795 domain-containing protein [Desulfatiglandales bacterium]
MIPKEMIGPCGLYCKVCAIYIADRDNNIRLKEKLVALYKGNSPDKGGLPESEALSVDDIHCKGCMSDDLFVYCKICDIRNCVVQKGLEGCHQCSDWPCLYIQNFPMSVGKKVIMRVVPYWREHGTEKCFEEEQIRYHCPSCGNEVFRGVMRCNKCKTPLDLD